MAIEEVGARLTLRDRVQFSREAREAAGDVEKIGDKAEKTSDKLTKMERRASRAGSVVGTAIGRGTGLALRGVTRLGRGIGGLALKLGKRGLQGAALGVAVGLPLLTKSLLGTAASLEATRQKATVVFGDALPGVAKWAEESAAKMGLTRSEAVGLAASFGDLMIPMGFTREQGAKLSAETINLAGALSQWSGGQQSAADVADVLSKAMLGETDGLKSLGISISAAEVEAELLAKGQSKLTGQALAQAKALATQSLIMRKSTDAQAAYAKGGLKIAGAQARIGAAVRELKERMAEKAAPYLAQALEGLLARLPQVEAFLRRVGTTVQQFARDALPPIREGLNSLRDSLTQAVDKFRGLNSGTGDAKAAGQSFGDTLRAVLTTVGTLVVKLAEFSRFLIDNRTAVMWVVGALAGLLGVVKVATALSRGFALAQMLVNIALRMNPIGLVVTAIALLVAGLVLAYKRSDTFRAAVDKVWAVLKKLVGFTPLGALIKNFDAVKRIVDKVKTAVQGVIDKLRNVKLPSLPKWLGGGDPVEARAQGGPVRASRPYLVGERGPELVVPQSSGYVLNAPRTASLLGTIPAQYDGGGTSAPSEVVHVHHVYLDGRQVTAAVKSHVRDELARR
jgi:hypothetical protein